MEAEEFYRKVGPVWCQGDIVRALPHIHLKPPLKALRPVNGPKGETYLKPFKYDPDITDLPIPPRGFQFAEGNGEEAPAFCKVSFGMVINYDCDYDNDPRHRLIAMVKPLDQVQPKDRDVIRANQNFSYLYLPAYSNELVESYVDFRRITSIDPAFLEGAERIASLTESALALFYIQFFLFLTRKDLTLALAKLKTVSQLGE